MEQAQVEAPDFIVDGSQAAGWIRAVDWSKSPLGRPADWPAALRSALRMVLAADAPLLICRGDDALVFFNDAGGRLIGTGRCAAAMGRPGREVWGEAWPSLAKDVAEVMAGGVAAGLQDRAVPWGCPAEAPRCLGACACLPIASAGARAGVGGVLLVAREPAAVGVASPDVAGAAEPHRSQRPRPPLAQQPAGISKTWVVSPDLLSIIDAKGRFQASNPAWEVTLGWSADELRRTPFLDFVHPDDIAETLAVWDDLRRGVPALRFENRYRTRAGGWRWLSWVSVPEENVFYSSARDIDAEKQQALELARVAAERDRIWMHSRDVIIVIDLKGDIVSCNPAAAEVLGWSAAEMTGRAVLDFIHPDDRPPLEADGSMIEDRYARPRIAVNRYRCKDGGERRMSWLSAGGDDGLIYSSGRDVTAETERAEALRAAEERLRQSQKMEAVGQLTGGIAHDFNNLLMGIGGSLQMMQRRLAQGRLADFDRYALAAQANLQRAAALTHRLLAFSRRQTLDPKPTDVNRLLGGMEELIRRAVGPAIDLEVVGADGLWTTFVDANQLENAVLNLCLNARDAMEGGGRITVETANHWLDEAGAREREVAPGAYVTLSVRDTGTGMTPEVAARAFEPFFMTKPLGAGTGLGLSMIYGFVSQSGGQVRIDSAPGRGTTLRLDLPRHAGAAEAAATRPALCVFPQASAGETVLVVDDEPTVRMLVAEALDDAGFTVLEAEVGSSALRVLEDAIRVDLLVTDIGLPGGLDGRQLAHAARSRRPALKVLFITGYAERAVPDDSLGADGIAILTKPFAIEALGAKVGGLLRG